MLGARPPAQPHSGVVVERPVRFPVGRPRPHLGASRVACAFLVYMLLPLRRCNAWAYSSLIHPDLSACPERVVGSACASSISRLARHSLALRPAHARCRQCVTRHTEGFSHFVTSMTAPVASGWSDGRVGLAPTGKAPPYHGAHPKRTFRVRLANLHEKNSDAGTLLGSKNEGGRYLRTNGPLAIEFRSGECYDDCRQSSAIRPRHTDFRSIQKVNASFHVNHSR